MKNATVLKTFAWNIILKGFLYTSKTIMKMETGIKNRILKLVLGFKLKSNLLTPSVFNEKKSISKFIFPNLSFSAPKGTWKKLRIKQPVNERAEAQLCH